MIFCRNAPRQVVIPHRASVALRLGVPICGPYLCVCGENIDQIMVFMVCRGRRSAGRHSRHSAVNDLIKRALTAAKIPSRLEPSCLSRNDVKRPDGLTLVPWSHGRCLVWDFTCPDTLAISHLHRASIAACTVADDRKRAKYTALCDQYCFVPVAVETLGALGEEAATFLRDIGRRIAVAAGEPRSTQFLFQRLSIAIQRGNAASVVGTASSNGCLDDVFYL